MKRDFWFALAFAAALTQPACSDDGDDDSGAPQGGSGGGSSGSGGDSGSGGTGAMGGTGGGGARENTCSFPDDRMLNNASVADGHCAYVWANQLNSPRGITVDENGDVIVIDRGASPRIVLLYDDDGDGVSGSDERVVLADQSGLNHGIAIHDGYLYASTQTTVYRWPYAGDRQPLGDPETVITGLDSGGHNTRTLLFDAQGRLYVSIGSGSNVDPDSSRARVIRFPNSALATGASKDDGELFADGLRNEVGLTLDDQGRVWGVENGRDELERSDLGSNISEDNPGEELNLFLEENAGRFYGYPYCWSEFNLPNGMGPGTQWADPDNTTRDDAWCQNTDNVIPPVLVMQGHSAPLDIKFYPGGSLPDEIVGDALITFHGSWNRSTATGYKVVRVPFGDDGMPSGDPVPLLESAGPGDTDDQWPHRPVGIGIGEHGQVFITSDASGTILAVGHDGS